MRKPLFTALMGAILAFPAIAMAADPGADIAGALTENPARLGHSPVFTLSAGAGSELPGLAVIQDSFDQWYDTETQRINIVLDVTTQEKAEATAARLDKLFESISGTEATSVAGISLGRLGFGSTASAMVKADSDTKVLVEPGNYMVSLDGSVNAIARADANATLGIPLGKNLAIGLTGKYAYLQSAFVAGTATATQDGGGSPTTSTVESRDSGEGYLADIGVSAKFGMFRADVALHDLGTIKWKAETATAVREHASPTHLAAGLSVQPVKAITLGGSLDNTLLGDPRMKVSAELKPLSFISLRSSYSSSTPNTPAFYTMGAGIRVLGIGIDANASVHGNLFSGGSATVSMRF